MLKKSVSLVLPGHVHLVPEILIIVLKLVFRVFHAAGDQKLRFDLRRISLISVITYTVLVPPRHHIHVPFTYYYSGTSH